MGGPDISFWGMVCPMAVAAHSQGLSDQKSLIAACSSAQSSIDAAKSAKRHSPEVAKHLIDGKMRVFQFKSISARKSWGGVPTLILVK
jgi:hypothetical protein